MQIVTVQSLEEIAAIRALFHEYHEGLDPSVRYRNFDAELDSLPGPYAPPDGGLFLALLDGGPVGCGALKPFSRGVSELKRLYVRPMFRRRGAGRALAMEIIEAACRREQCALRLDTLPEMREAIGLYRSLGFREIPAYFDDPLPGALFMELRI